MQSRQIMAVVRATFMLGLRCASSQPTAFQRFVLSRHSRVFLAGIQCLFSIKKQSRWIPAKNTRE
jgi:hypothetical protein